MNTEFAPTQSASDDRDARTATAAAAVPTIDAHTLIQWGFDVDLDGIAAHEDEARYVADLASKAGIRPVLVKVLASQAEPSNARARAFGKLSMALAG